MEKFLAMAIIFALSSSGLFLAPFGGRVIATMQTAKRLQTPGILQSR